MQLFSSSNEDFTHLTSLLGLYFQIRDDFANLKLESYAANKSFAEVELRELYSEFQTGFFGDGNVDSKSIKFAEKHNALSSQHS